MIEIIKNIKGTVFKANAESYLSKQAEVLIDLISEIELDNSKIDEKVQVGWNIYLISKKNDGVHILAPDYNKNPFNDTTEDLTISLWIQLQQVGLLKKLNMEGEEISFQDKIIYSDGVFELEEIYLERNKNRVYGDSGWYIGPVNDNEGNDTKLKAAYAYQLLKLRPSLLQVLAVEGGSLVVFSKSKIKSILNKDDVEIFKDYK